MTIQTEGGARPAGVIAATAPNRAIESDPTTSRTVDDAILLDDLLVEDVSIDGMCGVY